MGRKLALNSKYGSRPRIQTGFAAVAVVVEEVEAPPWHLGQKYMITFNLKRGGIMRKFLKAKRVSKFKL